MPLIHLGVTRADPGIFEGGGGHSSLLQVFSKDQEVLANVTHWLLTITATQSVEPLRHS